MSRSLVIMLHGVGSSGADLEPLAAAWTGLLPETAFVAPDAPYPFDLAPTGRQWFSVSGVTPANRPARVVKARAGFDAVVSGIVAAHGLAGRLDRVALLGFSQGSIMALDALATGRWPVAGVVAFSGRLSSPPPISPARMTRAILIHGVLDPVIPATESIEASAALQALGIDAPCHVLPRLGHSISSEGAALAATFLAEVLADNPPSTPSA